MNSTLFTGELRYRKNKLDTNAAEMYNWFKNKAK